MDFSSLEQLDLVRIVSAPDLADDGHGHQHFVPPLVSAHATGQPVVLGWLNRVPRSTDDGFVILAGGPAGTRSFPFLSDRDGRDREGDGSAGGGGSEGCLFPPGSRARRVDARTTVEALASLPAWAVLAAEPAPPDRRQPSAASTAGRSGSSGRSDRSDRHGAGEPRGRPGPVPAGGFEDVALHLSDVPFAWLLVAEPVSPGDVQEEFRAAQSAARSLANAAQQPGEQALELSLAMALLEHLHRGRSLGQWRVRLLAGSTSDERAHELSRLLAAASVLHDHPLRLVPGDVFQTVGRAMAAQVGGSAWNEPRSPFVTTSDHLALLGRTPGREVPGFRLTLPQTFDSNVEALSSSQVPAARPSVPLGVTLDQWGRPSGDFGVSFDALNRHMFVCGATGSGKSQTVHQLLEGLSGHGLPWLVIEPVKAEYRRMSDRLDAAGIPVHVIRLGAADQPPCMLNPLEPEQGFNLQTHLDMVTALFLASFEAEEPFPQVLAESLRRCYEDLGWDLATGLFKTARHPPAGGAGPGEPPRYPSYPTYPTLTELQAVADDVVKGIGYGPEVQANVRGFIKVRLGSLRLGTPGRFFESGHPLSVARLVEGNVVVELEDVGNDQDKAFVIGAVLLRLVEHLRVNRPQAEALRHVTVIEEAHRLLRKPERSGPASHAIETFAGLLAEVRAYGEGLVVAEQIPTKIVPDVVKNTAVQIMHRLPARDDRELVGGAMNMTPDQMGYVVGVGRGQAAVFAEGMDRPVLVTMRLGKDREADATSARSASELLAGRRSPCCPPSCVAAPCTVTEMQAGASWAGGVRDLELYVELLTVNLIRPQGPAPPPVDAVVAALHDAPERRRECGLGQVAQRSVRRRRGVLADYVDPDEVLEALVGFLEEIVAEQPGTAGTAGIGVWQTLAPACRLPETFDQPRRIAAYIGGDVGDRGSEEREVVGCPLLDLALECRAAAPDAPGDELRRRIADVVRPEHPEGSDPTSTTTVDDLAALLQWCFGWSA